MILSFEENVLKAIKMRKDTDIIITFRVDS